MVISVYQIYYGTLHETVRLHEALGQMETHLMDLQAETDWQILDGRDITVAHNVTAHYTLSYTEWRTEKLTVVFSAYGKTYEFSLERSFPDG